MKITINHVIFEACDIGCDNGKEKGHWEKKIYLVYKKIWCITGMMEKKRVMGYLGNYIL